MSFKSMPHKALAVIMISLAAIFAATPASSSQDWGPLSRSWSGEERVAGAGYFGINSAKTHAETVWLFSDKARDGNTVYAKTTVYIYRSCPSDGPRFCFEESHSSGEISNTMQLRTGKTKLERFGSRARGAVEVCVQLGFPRRDRCSDTAYPTSDY